MALIEKRHSSAPSVTCLLSKTIEDILAHIEADTEIIAVLDGQWAEPPIKDQERVTLIHHSQSIGQRAATNEAAKIAGGKWVMKVDAHCAFDQGLDRKMLADMQEDWTFVPLMKNLNAFDWVCPQGHRRYQSPSGPCQKCGEPTTRDIVWRAKRSPQSTAYYFDGDLHFQYWPELKAKQQGDLVESMMDKFEESMKPLLPLNKQERWKQYDMLKAACICQFCPSYTLCAQGNGEILFCLLGMSFRCIREDKGCLCPGCPLYPEYGLSKKDYCMKGSEKDQRLEKGSAAG